MSKKGLLLSYFDETLVELDASNKHALFPFVKGVKKVISKHNDTDRDLREKLALADYNFVPELQQKILVELQAVKLKAEGVPDFESEIYHRCKIKIDKDASLEELVKRGQYGIWGKNLTSEKYPKPIWEKSELEILIINFGKLATHPYERMIENVTKKFGHMGKFAGAYELAHLGWQHPTLQERFIELYGVGSQIHTRNHTWAHGMPTWRVPMLTYMYEGPGDKVRGFYTKDEGEMMYNHDFCNVGFAIIKGS